MENYSYFKDLNLYFSNEYIHILNSVEEAIVLARLIGYSVRLFKVEEWRSLPYIHFSNKELSIYLYFEFKTIDDYYHHNFTSMKLFYSNSKDTHYEKISRGNNIQTLLELKRLL